MNHKKKSEKGEYMEQKYLEMTLEEKYQLLGRMKSDCEYYLGAGMKQVSSLWGKTVDNHLGCMKELLFSIPMEDRPEWLTYPDIAAFDKQMDHRPVITAETLGLSWARFASLGSRSKDQPRQPNEVFFSVKKRIYDGKDGKKTFRYGLSEHGYAKLTPRMEEIFGTLFKENPGNRSIECIEWDDSWNIVFEDGIYISSRMCRMEKFEFAEWYRTIKPAAQ